MNERKAANAPPKPTEKPAFKELTTEELGRLGMAAQLKYQREFNEHKAALKKAAEPPKPAPPAPAEEKKLSESVRSNDTSIFAADQSMLSNAPLAPIAEESERGTVIESAKELAQSVVTPASDAKKPVFQLGAAKSKTIRPEIRAGRRESHMDALKVKLLERYALMNKAPTKEESSENESSDASDDGSD